MRKLTLALFAVVILMLVAACGPDATATPTPTAGPKVDGPTMLKHGAAGTFTVTYSAAGSQSQPRVIDVVIDEDDGLQGDDILIRRVQIDIGTGQQTGSQTFQLTCNYDGSNWDLVGTGTSQDENPHHIHAEHELFLAPNEVSDNHVVTCWGAGGVPKSVDLTLSSSHQARREVSLFDGEMASLVVTLTMSTLVADEETFSIMINEDDYAAPDDTLETVSLKVPAGTAEGTANAVVTCKWDGANWDLVGSPGTSQDDGPAFLLYSYLDRTGPSNLMSAPFVTVRCVAPAEEEQEEESSGSGQ